MEGLLILGVILLVLFLLALLLIAWSGESASSSISKTGSYTRSAMDKASDDYLDAVRSHTRRKY